MKSSSCSKWEKATLHAKANEGVQRTPASRSSATDGGLRYAILSGTSRLVKVLLCTWQVIFCRESLAQDGERARKETGCD